MSYGGGGGGGEEILQQNQSSTTEANMTLAFCADGTAVYKPIMPHDTTFEQHQQQHDENIEIGIGGVAVDVVNVGGFNINVEPMKRKRGRPRKYSPPEGSLTSPPHRHPLQQQSPNPAKFQSALSQPMAKKARGRPPGSGHKAQLPAIGTAGVGFTPHVITVKAGEDVLSKIMSFSQNGTRAVCILSANGAISNVTLRQPATSGGTVTYEGRFEILSLSGSFLLSESDGQRSRIGGLSVSLAGPSDGHVMGGGVAGLLIAASSVQVIVGSFTAQDRKELKFEGQPEILSAPPKLVQRASASGSSPSRGTLSESSGGAVSPLNQRSGAFNNSNPLGMPNMTWK